MSKPTIQVLTVKSNQEKLLKLCQAVHHHFGLRERLLIAAPSDEVADYIDQLLWRMPSDSFLPHKKVAKESDFPVIITTMIANLNQARVLINLMPGVHPLS